MRVGPKRKKKVEVAVHPAEPERVEMAGARSRAVEKAAVQALADLDPAKRQRLKRVVADLKANTRSQHRIASTNQRPISMGTK